MCETTLLEESGKLFLLILVESVKVTEQLASHNEMLLGFEIIVNILIKALDEEVSSVPVPKPLNNGRD